jgi:hypothetical protein
MRRSTVCFLAALLAAAAVPAWADCTCRAAGVVAAHGQAVCIPTPAGIRFARCIKVSNVASWQFLDAPCPMAALGSDPARDARRKSAAR